MQMLERIVELSRSRNYQLVFVVFPMEMQLSPEMLNLYRTKFRIRVDEAADFGEPQRRIKEFGERAGVPVLDLLPAFRAAHGKDLFLRNKSITYDPVHLSETGHEVAAEAIAVFLQCRATNSRSRVRAKSGS
jgi:hypothetical protein